METTIQVRYREQTKSERTGAVYWRIETQNGEKFTCFDKDAAEALKPGIQASVEIVDKGRYKNIVKVYSHTIPELIASPAEDKFSDARKEKAALMLTSYDKDLRVAGVSCDVVEIYKKILEKL